MMLRNIYRLPHCKMSFPQAERVGNPFEKRFRTSRNDRQGALTHAPRIRSMVQSLYSVAILMLFCFPAGLTQAAQEAAVPSAAYPTDIKISFKMNTSITRGMYMGDRWISPPTYYNVEEGKEITVEAAAQGLDAQGKLIDISPVWKAGDSAIMTISPDKGPKVKLTIRKGGRTNLTVTAGGVSRKLPVKAWYKDKAMNVEISQK